MTDKLLVSVQDGIKRITINRAERRNAVDWETMKLLREAFEQSHDDDSRVIILTGAGDSFCAGADLETISEHGISGFDITRAIRENLNQTILTMRALPIPIVARVHGHAVGAGCNYALACDLSIASEEALFGQVFVRIGLMPDAGGTFILSRLVGYQKAFELMATGEIISARKAEQLGMVNRVTPLAELDDTVDSLAQRLAQAPRLALSKIKAGLNYAAQSDLAGALDFEAVNQDACFHSTDFIEGLNAFLQKRKPVFGKAAGGGD